MTITLILGGARSGKSTHAEKLAAELGETVLYVATAEGGDDEMRERIAAHQGVRPASWRTIEAPRSVGAALAVVHRRPDVMLVDCLTLLVSNIVLAMETCSQGEIEAVARAEVEAILQAQARLGCPLILVSNEVGLGLVPPYPVGRLYRDVLGRINQQVAARAETVLFMVAGLPMVVK